MLLDTKDKMQALASELYKLRKLYAIIGYNTDVVGAVVEDNLLSMYSSFNNKATKHPLEPGQEHIKVITSYIAKSGYCHKISTEIRIDDALVYIAIRIREKDLQNYANNGILSFDLSFPGAIFNTACNVIMRRLPESDISFMDNMGYEDILRHAAASYMQRVLGLLPERIESIASMTHESRHCHGRMALINNFDMQDRGIQLLVKFDNAMPFNQQSNTQIRKLLEMTSEKYCLLVEMVLTRKETMIGKFEYQEPQYFITGIARTTDVANAYFVEFKGFMKWRAIKDEKVLLNYSEGKVIPCAENGPYIDERYIQERLDITPDMVSILTSVISKAQEQEHGTMLIITDQAEQEATRLANMKRGIKVKAVDLMKNLDVINELTSIDGALFIDLTGKCHGIGIIVDGIAAVEGTPSRGARYNSANTYIHNLQINSKCIACVISEDKTIDILPHYESPSSVDNVSLLAAFMDDFHW